MTVSTHVPQDNPCAMDGTRVQLKDAPVFYHGQTKVIAQGLSPCVRPGMLIQDCDQNLYGIATLCTENAVTYTADDGRVFTANYDAISLHAAGPENLADADASTYKDARPQVESRHDHDRHASPRPEYTPPSGVRASIGDYVFFTDCDAEGEMVAATDKEAVIVNQDGDVQVNCWHFVAVQAAGPCADDAGTGTPLGVSIASALPSITDEQRADIDSDPYRVAALRALDLMAHVDRIQDKYADLDRDRLAAVELLSQVEMALGTLSDNRTRRVLDGDESEVSA